MGKEALRETVNLHSVHLTRTAAITGITALLLTLFVAWHGTPIPGDVRVIREFQDLDFIRRNEDWVNSLGLLQWQIPLLLGAVALAGLGHRLGFQGGTARERAEAIWILLGALVLRFLTVPMKPTVGAERPSSDWALRITHDFGGYSFPSGHTYSAVLVFGALAIVAPALLGRTAGTAVRVFCIAIVLLAGPARMVVGAHWPSDVIGAYLWGVAALCLACLVSRPLARGARGA